MDKSATKRPSPSPEASQHQLAEAFRSLQQCVQHCHKAVFFTDGAGILQRVNPAFEKITGYASAESVGKDLSWMAAEGPTCKAYRRIWKEIFEDRIFHGTLEVRRKNGERFQMDLTAIPVRNKGGEIVGLVCTGRDLRQEKEREAHLFQARRTNVHAALTRALAHDLNDMLMIISGCAERALDGIPAESLLRRELQEIRVGAQRACELGRELTAFGQQRQEKLEPLSINSAVHEVARILPKLIGPDFQLEIVLGEDLGKVQAATREVREMLVHLAMVACETVPDGGKLTVQSNTVELGAASPTGVPVGRYAVISVRVTKSTPATALPNAFAVHQSDQWVRSSEQALVDEIARRNHGFASMEVQPGNSTAIDVYLPVVGELAAKPAHALAASASGN